MGSGICLKSKGSWGLVIGIRKRVIILITSYNGSVSGIRILFQQLSRGKSGAFGFNG